MWSRILLLLAAFLLLTAGCGSPPSADIERADIRGVVRSVTRPDGAGGATGALLVEGSLEKDTQFDKASVTVTGKTAIYREEDGALLEASFDALRTGQEGPGHINGLRRRIVPGAGHRSDDNYPGRAMTRKSSSRTLKWAAAQAAPNAGK